MIASLPLAAPAKELPFFTDILPSAVVTVEATEEDKDLPRAG